MSNRRRFMQSLAGSGMLSLAAPLVRASEKTVSVKQLEQALSKPVLHLDDYTEPVKIKSIGLYRFGRDHFVRTESEDGAVGFAVTNSRAFHLYPMLQDRVIPFFMGKDARELEALMQGVYLYNSNYKYQGLAFWCPVAWVEMSILDLLGKIKNRHISALFGGRVRNEVGLYAASGNRDTTPEEEVEVLQGLIESYGVKAVKFKVGGRMRNNRDSMPGRTEGLIPLTREVLGDEVILYADSNGSYDAQHAIKIGRMLEEIGAGFFEEPCPFDHLHETKKVADALSIPVAGGEVESSQRHFRWMIANQAVQVVQPDLHYYGGHIRAKRVANMAAAAGLPMVLHMSGGGTGFVDAINFTSYTPNSGPYQEFKGDLDKVGPWYDPPLRMKDGKVNIPTGPGLGIHTDPDWLREAEQIV